MDKKKRIVLISALFIFILLFLLLFNRTCQPQGEGTLVVTGTGQDLYHVFNEKSGDKVNFTSTGSSMILPAGNYRLELHGQKQKITIKPEDETIIKTGVFKVKGQGINLYEVWDKENTRKLDFTETGKGMELFAGEYTIKLNHVDHKVNVKEQDSTLVETGQILVKGNTQDLYEVYTADGTKKLNFTFLGKPFELLPGEYLVKWPGQSTLVTIEALKVVEVE